VHCRSLLVLDSHNTIMWAVAARLVKIDAKPIQSKNYYMENVNPVFFI